MRYTWADVMKTLLGLQQEKEGLRRLAFIIHCSLIPKKDRSDIQQMWPLPFDHENKSNVWERLKQRQLKKLQPNG